MVILHPRHEREKRKGRKRRKKKKLTGTNTPSLRQDEQRTKLRALPACRSCPPGEVTGKDQKQQTTKNKSQQKQAIYELGQRRCCQSGRWAMPRSILRIWTWFFDTVFIMYQQTTGKTALDFLFFFFERSDRYSDPKLFRQAFHFFARAVQTWGENFRSKFAKLSGTSQK